MASLEQFNAELAAPYVRSLGLNPDDVAAQGFDVSPAGTNPEGKPLFRVTYGIVRRNRHTGETYTQPYVSTTTVRPPWL